MGLVCSVSLIHRNEIINLTNKKMKTTNDINSSLIEKILSSYNGNESGKEVLRSELAVFNTIQLTLLLDTVSKYELVVA